MASSRFLQKQPYFGITRDQLRELMEFRGKEAVDQLKLHGGVKGICKKLNTSSSNGIKGTPADIKSRIDAFGVNVIPVKPIKPISQLIWEALQDMTLIILQVAALISLGLSIYHPSEDENSYDWIEGLAICLSVVVVVTVTAFNDYSKEKQFQMLQKRIQSENNFFVIRDGKILSISVNDILVGDVCQIKYGDLLPADGLVIQSNDLRIDESSLTGESKLVKKAVYSDPMLLSSTQVTEGSGRFVVTAVGVNSQAGIIFTLLGTALDIEEYKLNKQMKLEKRANDKTSLDHGDMSLPSSEREYNLTGGQQSSPKEESSSRDKQKSILQTKLTTLAIQIGYFGSAIAFLTVAVLILQFCVHTFIIQGLPWHNKYISEFLRSFIIGVTVLVVAVPEGLPLAVTLSLAYSVKKMMKDNNLVRHLDACETMGNATVICSDKTGTLTTNRMTVVQSYVCETKYFITPEFNKIPKNVGDILITCISINTMYTSQVTGNYINEPLQQIGNKTECALLEFALRLGTDYQNIRSNNPEETFVHVYTFNSDRKSMSTVVPFLDGYRLYTKGAAEVVLDKCGFIYDQQGKVLELTNSIKTNLVQNIINEMAGEGLRTILLAHRDFVVDQKSAINTTIIKSTLSWDNEDDIINNLTAICVVGIEDPVRPEVPEAIRICQRAGITVRMVTGDNLQTARSIALKCGIIKKGDNSLVLGGKRFNKLIRDDDHKINQSKFDSVWPRLRVLARSSPMDKFNLVNGIINSNISEAREVVAVTGDGTNDAPALRIADVGFAMGVTGTDVAKEACDIILTDDNFNSIVKAVMWGRNVYDSICKFLQFQLTVNIVAVIVAFAGACAIRDTPLKAVQMLWVNLIMDTFASLALATEMPTNELLLRKPYGRTRPLITKLMMKNIICHAVYQLIIIFLLLFYGDFLFDIPSGRVVFEDRVETKCSSQHFTMIFNTFVLMTLCNEINARKINNERNVFENLCSNFVFVIIWLGTAYAQFLITEYGGMAFCTEPLGLDLWGWCVFFGISTLLWGQVIATFPSERLSKRMSWDPVDQERHLSSDDGVSRDHSRSDFARKKWAQSIKSIRTQIRVTRAMNPQRRDIRSQSDALRGIRERISTLEVNRSKMMLPSKLSKQDIGDSQLQVNTLQLGKTKIRQSRHSINNYSQQQSQLESGKSGTRLPSRIDTASTEQVECVLQLSKTSSLSSRSSNQQQNYLKSERNIDTTVSRDSVDSSQKYKSPSKLYTIDTTISRDSVDSSQKYKSSSKLYTNRITSSNSINGNPQESALERRSKTLLASQDAIEDSQQLRLNESRASTSNRASDNNQQQQ